MQVLDLFAHTHDHSAPELQAPPATRNPESTRPIIKNDEASGGTVATSRTRQDNGRHLIRGTVDAIGHKVDETMRRRDKARPMQPTTSRPRVAPSIIRSADTSNVTGDRSSDSVHTTPLEPALPPATQDFLDDKDTSRLPANGTKAAVLPANSTSAGRDRQKSVSRKRPS